MLAGGSDFAQQWSTNSCRHSYRRGPRHPHPIRDVKPDLEKYLIDLEQYLITEGGAWPVFFRNLAVSKPGGWSFSPIVLSIRRFTEPFKRSWHGSLRAGWLPRVKAKLWNHGFSNAPSIRSRAVTSMPMC